MKKTSKVFAIIFAAALALTLFTAPVLADPGTAVIDIYIDGEYYFSLDADVEAGTTVYDAINQNAETLEPVWTLVPDYYVPNVYWHVLASLMGAGSDPIGEASGFEAEAWSTINPGYGLVSVDYDENDDPIAYNYVYAGYDWVYSVNGVQPGTLYMDVYDLSDGDVIELSYDLQIWEWTESSPWMPAYPYI
ncbi:MAG: hypothetical protein LBL37_01745 [Gracilibacteraceae bacterium]|jgi:hypothetical protein|nr:hypothetical protein [Gracilibacteraceae bacterium]